MASFRGKAISAIIVRVHSASSQRMDPSGCHGGHGANENTCTGRGRRAAAHENEMAPKGTRKTERSAAALCLMISMFLGHPIVALIPVATMKTSSATIYSLLFVAGYSSAFFPPTMMKKNPLCLSSTLFEEDEEMIPVAKNYIHAKYKQVAASHGHSVANKEDVREVLHSILPPVTPEELEREETSILNSLLSHKQNSADAIDEDDFVESIMRNSYWDSAGDIVVKELMYFDSLHSYYKTGKPLLNNDDYDELHENLTWEGSSVATMSAKEAEFVSAVAAAKRGEPQMDDGEYGKLKAELKEQGSWVVNRGSDALEKLGLNTFMGYLHRAL